nr:immunoglobulin light chain junction region [Macaca mulatta]
CMQALEFLLTF